MKPRIVTETDEYEQPGVTHGVRRTTTTQCDGGAGYFTLCGEVLISSAKRPSQKRGIPNCVRCVIAACEEAVLWP
jgi:hypothetical protein